MAELTETAYAAHMGLVANAAAALAAKADGKAP
jgi:hypothetical protein